MLPSGAELKVLQTIDFSRLKVKVFIVELDGHDKEKDQAVHDLLTAGVCGHCTGPGCAVGA